MGLGIFSPQNFLNTKNDYQLQKKKKCFGSFKFYLLKYYYYYIDFALMFYVRKRK